MSKDTVNPEEEYFHREDQERIRKLKEQMEHDKDAHERQALRDLHHLRCGKCGEQMHTKVFKGLDIEVCPACGAVLLDPGELEQLVGRDESGSLSFITDFFHFTRKKGQA